MNILKVLPKNLLSRVTGRLVGIESPSGVALKARDWFIRRYKINVDEAELPLEQYPSISKLFVRKLKPGIRPIGSGLVHPCDGALTCAEPIDSVSLVQAKGKTYELSQFLQDPKAFEVYGGGSQLTYYLCPTDYHRVHSPVDGVISKIVHVPGHLWPVNSWSVENIDHLFAVNERMIFYIQTVLGPVALVMVGATNVGKITVSFDPDVVSNRAGQSHVSQEKKYSPGVKIKKGEELGVFNMGSTVIMIYPRGMLNVLPKLGPTRLGASV